MTRHAQTLAGPEAAAVPQAAVLQRACACGAAGGVSGQCPACAQGERLGLQPKLTINPPGDRWEQEADRIADQVVSDRPLTAQGPLPVTPLIQRQAVSQQEDEEEPLQAKASEGPRQEDEEEATLQARRASTGRAPTARNASFAGDLAAESRAGHPLDAETRAYFEPRFGRDLSNVRLHSDARAARLSHQANARAFTHKNHVFFGAGELDTRSTQGKRLLAHELAHTLQQASSSAPSRANLQRSEAQETGRGRRRKDRHRRRLLRLLKRVEHRAEKGRKVLATPRRSEKAEEILCLAAAGDSDFQLSEDARQVLTEIVQAGEARPPRCATESTTPEPVSEERGAESEELEDEEDEAFDKHYQTEEARNAGEELQEDFGLLAIAAGDTEFEWTVGELQVLRRAFDLVPARHGHVLERTMIAKVTAPPVSNPGVLGEMIDQRDDAGTPDFAMVNMQALFDIDGQDQSITILHEVGHGLHFINPALVQAFVRFVRRRGFDTDEMMGQIGGRRFRGYIRETWHAGQRSEYFVTAYAVSLVDPGRMPEAMAEFFARNV